MCLKSKGFLVSGRRKIADALLHSKALRVEKKETT